MKDAQNNDVASTGNTFQMPKGGATVSAVFEQGVHGTTEFVWGYYEPSSFVNEATIYDGVTTVNLQQTGQSYNILKYDEYTYSIFRLDKSTYDADIPYAGGTGEFYQANNPTDFMIPDNGQTGYYDITLTDVGNGKWGVSILPTPAQMDVVPDQTYTGSAITPEPLVIAGSLSLTKGTDYVYSYTNNTDAGTATVRATFQGTYASLGYVEKTFTIMPDWTYNTDGGYYEISDADDLNALATFVNAGIDCTGLTFKQTADIDMQGVSYTPIGLEESHPFRGTYDGDGYFVKNISHAISGENKHSGFVGRLEGTVKNVNLKDCNFTAFRAGGIAGGLGEGSVIQNCNVLGGTITGTDTSGNNGNGSAIGGIVGYNYCQQAVDNCFVTADFGGNARDKGPVVGRDSGEDGSITDCYYVNGIDGACNDYGTQVTVYDITLGDGITISDNFRTVGRTATNTYYFGKENDAITLSYSGTVPAGYQYCFTASAGTLSGSTLTMPAADVTVTATLRKLLTHADITVTDIEAQTYTGNAIEPEVTVKDGETTLILGTHYTVAYADNTNVGTANVTITGIGTYDGEVTKIFTIIRAMQSDFKFANATVEKATTDVAFTIEPTGAEESPAITYASSNEAVATVVASTGEVTIKAAGLTTITATASETDNYQAATAKYTLVVKGGETGAPVSIALTEEYGTFCWGEDLDFSGTTGLTAYIAAGYDYSSGVLTMLRVTSVPAGTGLLLKGEAGSSYTATVTQSTCFYANLLTGVTTTTTLSPTDGGYTNYVLGKKGDNVGFYKLSEAGSIAAGKAYLHLPTQNTNNNARQFVGIRFEDETTPLLSPEGEDEGASPRGGLVGGSWYTLDGRKLEGKPTRKGLYIHNGKVEMVK